MRRVALALSLLLLAGCATPPSRSKAPYVPDRRDYATFRTGWDEVLDPNYLPFMVHRVSQSQGREDLLILCRWDDGEMPLPIYIDVPVIPDEIQNEFDPREPEQYVRGVEHALATWEENLEGLVRFRRVDDPDRARLRIVLLGARAPVTGHDVKVLGTTRVGDACRPGPWDPDAERLEVEFEIPELRIYVADEFGMLAADQVEWIALHEIGHALGMRSHSPIRGDLMYEVVRDRMIVAEGLSVQDVNSFVSLYRLPNGTVYGSVAEGDPPPRHSPPPSGPVRMSLAPYVDTRLGFSLLLPAGWLAMDSGQGMVAIDGQSWHYSASFQVVVSRYPTIDAYLERFGDYYLSRGRLLHSEEMVVNGRRAVQGVLARPDGERVEEITLIESGDGRLLTVTADCAVRDLDAYAPWFEATLASLEIWDL